MAAERNGLRGMPVVRCARWPRYLSWNLTLPETALPYNVEVSAQRFPDKPCALFYGTPVSFGRFRAEMESLAGWLQEIGVRPGDRVLLYLQNSPQLMLGFYAILRANAVAVPVSPMLLTAELQQCVARSGARIAIACQELCSRIEPLLGAGLEHILVVTYSDYLEGAVSADIPEAFRAPCVSARRPCVTLWHDALAAKLRAAPLTAGPDDLCLIAFTSGTTGVPKGVMHSHRTVMSTLLATTQWFHLSQDSICLATLPFFHVTGMQLSMNGPLFAGATVVLLPRWDPASAARMIARHGITHWTAVPTMLVDLLNDPGVDQWDLSSLKVVNGGGATMPEAVAQKLAERGLRYIEGYGLTETMGPTHFNPPDHPKQQCLGIPIQGTESMVIDSVTCTELPAGAVGEIVSRGPQVFRGYWEDRQATQESFLEIGGRRWLRTGDLGRVDEDGYFFLVDRLKRMINASGYKVWPAEVESWLFHHPAIQEACVVAARDPHRGETVKAVVVLKEDFRGRVAAEDIIGWAHSNMASYKCPRIVQFVDRLPRSASGKVLWRTLEER